MVSGVLRRLAQIVSRRYVIGLLALCVVDSRKRRTRETSGVGRDERPTPSDVTRGYRSVVRCLVLSGSTPLPRDLSFDELRKKGERVLPAEIARLGWNGVRYPFLDYVYLSTAGYLLQRYRRLYLTG